MEHITSRNNPLITRISKLSDKKYRDKEGFFAIEGIKLFEEMIKAEILPEYCFVTENNIQILKNLPETVDKFIVTDSVYSKISTEKSPQGVFCVIKYLDKFHKFDTIYSGSSASSVFCLDSVRDPGNLGTIIRTARAFGIETLILSDDCADIYSPKTLRATMGAIFKVKIQITDDMARTLKDLSSNKGYKTYAAALNDKAVTLDKISVTNKSCFVVGNEGHGLSEDIIKSSSDTVYIPMKNDCESLNASVAASLLMWEIFKSSSK